MTEARRVVAQFVLDRHTLTAAADGTGSGRVTSEPSGINCPDDCSQGYNYGTVVNLTATADTGSIFTGWNGVCTGVDECAVTMTETQHVTATFTLLQYMLTVTVDGAGSGLVTSDPASISCPDGCEAMFDFGTVITLTASADTSSSFFGWAGACTGAGDCVVTMDAARSVTATFAGKVFLPIIIRQ
jgi:hypothetical protein